MNILGYKFICSEYKCGMNLENLCYVLRSRESAHSMIGTVCEKCNLPSYTCLNASVEMVGAFFFIRNVSIKIIESFIT